MPFFFPWNSNKKELMSIAMWFCVWLCMSKYSLLLPCSIFFIIDCEAHGTICIANTLLHLVFALVLSGSFHVLLRNLLYGLVWSNLCRRIQFLVVVAWNDPERQAIEANMLGGLEWRFAVSNSLRTWFTTSNPRVSYLYSLYTQSLVSSNFVCFERASFMNFATNRKSISNFLQYPTND